MKCVLCDFSGRQIDSHVKRIHGLDAKEYHDQHRGGHGKCEWCKGETEFLGIARGYKRLCLSCGKKNKPTCLEFWTLGKGFSEQEAKERLSMVMRERSRLCIEYWEKRGHSIESAKQQIAKVQSSNNAKKLAKFDPAHWMSLGLGQTEALQRAEESLKTMYPSHLEFWEKRLSPNEAKKAWLEFVEQDSRRKSEWSKSQPKAFFAKFGTSLEHLRLLHGDNAEEEYKRINHAKGCSTRLEHYLINDRSLEEAKCLLKNRQDTCSVQAIQKREHCSKDEALSIQRLIVAKRKASIAKSPDAQEKMIAGRIKGFERSITKKWSSISQTLFWALVERVSVNPFHVYFATYKLGEYDDSKNHEFFVRTPFGARALDFFLSQHRLIIEFQGSYWHRAETEEARRRREFEIRTRLSDVDFLYVDETEFRKNQENVISSLVEQIKRREPTE